MDKKLDPRVVFLICFFVGSTAVVGYFVGLQSPMNPSDRRYSVSAPLVATDTTAAENPMESQLSAGVMVATHYLDMAAATKARSLARRTSLVGLESEIDPLAEFTITEDDKKSALATREFNRAYNGAPPTVPHPIEQRSAESCLACHGQGFKSNTLRISQMSHRYLDNCTQCHVERDALSVARSSGPWKSLPDNLSATASDNLFTGMPAPNGGERAYPGAPPVIPHSTWMRSECMSCHGYAGLHGIRATHPWRKSCQQCHASSAERNQLLVQTEPTFLPAIKITDVAQ